MAKTALSVTGQASDEQAMEAVVAIQAIAARATDEIQRLQQQVQRNLSRIARETQAARRAA